MTITLQSIYVLVALIIALDVHEFSHALMAHQQGDDTPRYMGRLTLNPLAHLDPLGTLMMFLMVFRGFGFAWGKPVPVNPMYLRSGFRVGMGIVSLAGPLSNFVLAALFGLPVRLASFWALPQPLILFFAIAAQINIWLGLFNLIPLAPLDGSKVLQGILGAVREPWAFELGNALMRLDAQGPMILVMVFLVDSFLPISILGLILGPPNHLLRWLFLGG